MKTTISYYVIGLGLVFFLNAGNALAQADLEEMRRQQDAEIAAMQQEYTSYIDNALQEYENYEKQAQKEFENYARQVKGKWGTLVDNTQKTWVEYNDDFTSRSQVDFEKGTVTVEILLDENEAQNKKKVDEELSEAVDKVLASRATTNPYRGTADATHPLTEKPVLDGLVDVNSVGSGESDSSSGTQQGASTSTPQERKEATEKIVKNAPRQTSTVQGEDGKKRTVVKVEMPMVKDHLSRNATLYKNIVLKYSEKFNVEPALIFAVIEQESAFDPQATSWVPAYGLMQLVPTSGGRDAYRKVTGRDQVPQRDYLFNPDNNIQLGTAYLRILFDQFNKVSDADCRRLCVIAAYNTGAGNVNRAFTGGTKFAPAVAKINQHTYYSLFNYLTTNLHHDEARKYVKGVTARREKYLK